MSRMLNIFDFLLSKIFSAIALAGIIFARLIFWVAIRFDSAAKLRNSLVFVVRSDETIGRHLELNSKCYVENYYTRPAVDRSIIICAGGAETSCRRLGRRLIGIDVKIPKMYSLKKIAPRTSRVLEDTLAAIIIARFMLSRHLYLLQVLAPSPLVWRAMMLKFLINPLLLVEVRGNVDLIFAASTPPWGKPVRQSLALARVLVQKIQLQILFRSADAVIGYNINNKDSAISNGAHPRKTYLSRILVDQTIVEAELHADDDLDFMPEGGRTILIWSRLSPEKMLSESLAILACVMARAPDVMLVLIGDGPQRAELERRARELGIDGRVKFAGYQPRRVIRAAGRRSHLAIVPYGGSSLVEAGLLALPTVAFDIEWHHEIIRDGDTGWLIDYRFVDDAADAIMAALDDPVEALRRGRRLQEATRLMFDPERINQREALILEQVLSRRSFHLKSGSDRESDSPKGPSC